MVYCFSCGAPLGREPEASGFFRCHECRDERPKRARRDVSESRSSRPVLTLVKTFPLATPPEPPPFAA